MGTQQTRRTLSSAPPSNADYVVKPPYWSAATVKAAALGALSVVALSTALLMYAVWQRLLRWEWLGVFARLVVTGQSAPVRTWTEPVTLPRRQMRMRVLASTLVLVVLACGCASDTATAPPVSTTSAVSTTTAPTSTAPVDTVAASVDQVATTTPTPTPTGPDPNPIRATLADGCPSTVGGHPDFSSTAASWIANPDAAGLADSFVPGKPSAALICRYAALDALTPLANGVTLNAGDLYSSTHLEAQAATALAETLNKIVPWDIGSGCLPTENKARYTAIIFAIAGRTDVDLWLEDWYGCPEVSNGSRDPGLLINGQGDDFLANLDNDSPRAPGRDH